MTCDVRDDSKVRFRAIFMRPSETDAEEWIVGCAPTNTAIALPAIGIRAIEQLQSGASISTVHTYLLEHFQEDIDVADLVSALADAGLVQAIDQQEIVGERAIGQNWLGHISPAAVAWFYSPLMLALSLILIVLGPVFWGIDVVFHHQTLDILWNNSYAVDTISLFFIGMLILFIHECGHLFAARAFGITAELTFGHRLFFLVAVSRIGGIWQLPRRQRLIIYAGGMRNDLVLAAIGAISLFLADHHILLMPVSLYRLIGILLISLYLGIAWELQIFLKTDMYHLLADLTNRHDLPERTQVVLLKLWHDFLARLHDAGKSHSTWQQDEEMPQAMDRFVLAYTIITVVGVALASALLIWFILPALIMATYQEWQTWITSVATRHVVSAFDSGLALAITGLSVGLLLWSWNKTLWVQRLFTRFSAKFRQ